MKAWKVCSNRYCEYERIMARCPLCKRQLDYVDSFIALCRNCKQFFSMNQIGKNICSKCGKYGLIFKGGDNTDK